MNYGKPNISMILLFTPTQEVGNEEFDYCRGLIFNADNFCFRKNDLDWTNECSSADEHEYDEQ